MFGLQHVLLTVFGTSFQGVEEWSFSMRINQLGETQSLPTQAQANSVLTVVQSWWNAAVNGNPSSHSLIGVKLAPQDLQGHYPPDTTAYEALTAADPGPTVSPIMAPQLALVISLRTEKPRGQTSRGRFYIPCPADTFNAAGQMATMPANVANGIKTMINGVNAVSGLGTVSVFSNPADPEVGGILPVLRVEVGNVVDTQRRRRESIPETYTSVTL